MFNQLWMINFDSLSLEKDSSNETLFCCVAVIESSLWSWQRVWKRGESKIDFHINSFHKDLSLSLPLSLSLYPSLFLV